MLPFLICLPCYIISCYIVEWWASFNNRAHSIPFDNARFFFLVVFHGSHRKFTLCHCELRLTTLNHLVYVPICGSFQILEMISMSHRHFVHCKQDSLLLSLSWKIHNSYADSQLDSHHKSTFTDIFER